MLEGVLTRYAAGRFGTFGFLEGAGFRCETLELPWYWNRRDVSCIPAGVYVCRWTHSNRFGRMLYEVGPVAGRSGIRFHAGNWAGDRLVWPEDLCNVAGCILPGERVGLAVNSARRAQLGVVESTSALERLHGHFGRRPWRLTVVDDLSPGRRGGSEVVAA